MSLITGHGSTLAVTSAGQGPVIVLLHGFPLDCQMWLPLVELLEGAFHCIAMDLRGFGGSTVEQQYDLDDLANDVEFIRSHLAPDQAIHLVGLSMGGYVAFEYWRLFARNLRSLTLVNTRPGLDGPEGLANRYEMARRVRDFGAWNAVGPMVAKLLAKAALGTKIEEFVSTIMKTATADAVSAAQIAMAQRRDFTPLISQIRIPTLVVTGEFDPIAPPAETREWSQQIPGATYRELEAAGHLSPIEKPTEFHEVFLQFLKQL